MNTGKHLRILYITDPGVVGGATRSLIDVVSAMMNRNVECIVCTSANNELNLELNRLGITNFASGHMSTMDLPAYTPWKRPFKKVVKKAKYYITLPYIINKIEKTVDFNTIDIIHTNSARNDIGCILSKRHKIPHVMHIREFGYEDFGCICYRNEYEKFLNKYTTEFIAISKAVKSAWVNRGIDEKKVTVIYNGVDNTKIVAAQPENTCHKKTLNMVIAGGVCEAKGQIQIIEAMGILQPDISVNLDIIGWGDPNYINAIKEKAINLGVLDRIRFLGARNDIYELLKNYDIGLTCSRAEGFGRVTAEYMHAKLAVIVSSTGANTELVENGVNGLTYGYGNVKELANCIEELYNDRLLLIRLSEQAHCDAAKRFTKEINASNIYKVYCDVLKYNK